MAKQTYSVDWSDPPYPEIIRTEDCWNPTDDDRLTLAEAKERIIDSFQGQINHARSVIRDTRAIRAADIKSKDEEAQP